MFKRTGSQLRTAPDIPVLQQLLNKCFQQPGEKVQVFWRTTENQIFFLDLVYSLKDRRPAWQLICEKSGRRTLIADYAGHDILLVYKQISTAANNAMEERSGEESSRVSRTRDSRAAAANWLESKKEAGSEDEVRKQPDREVVRPGLLSNLRQDIQQEVQRNIQQDEKRDIQQDEKRDIQQDEKRNIQQNEKRDIQQDEKRNIQQNEKRDIQQDEKRDIQQDDRRQEVSAALKESPWRTSRAAAQSTPLAEAQSTSSDPAPIIPPKEAQSTASAAHQPTKATSAPPGPAPVKVTGAGPQANPPRALQAPVAAQKPQTPPTLSGKERSTVHPDKGATTPDKKPGSQDQADPLKKLISPEKITTSPKSSAANWDLGKSALPTNGDLADLSVARLLKQLKVGQVTARLDFVDDLLSAIVFVEDGKPVEAWMGELNGDSALLELLLWTSGNYSLSIGMTATNRNVKTSPEVLVEHNKNIASLLGELATEGLTATSSFAPSNPLLSSEDFDRMATPDAPMELEKLAKLYVKLDGKKSIADLNDLQVLPRPMLVQAIHHLYYNGIIDIVDPTQARKELVVTPKIIDGAAIQSVMMSLRRVDTGLFIYPAFLYFLEEEFFRIYRAKGSLSILIFEMRELVAADGLLRRVSLSSDAITDANMRISKCKRHTDIVAHYEFNDFAIILPNTASNGTRVFANKIIKALIESPLIGTQGKKLSFSFGSASMPEDFKDLAMLLGAAEMAMTFARQRGKPLVLFKEMEI